MEEGGRKREREKEKERETDGTSKKDIRSTSGTSDMIACKLSRDVATTDMSICRMTNEQVGSEDIHIGLECIYNYCQIVVIVVELEKQIWTALAVLTRTTWE